MSRILALLGIALLAGCQTPGETVIGRANGRDIIVTESEIQKRADDRGISRTVALRELRREREMRAAVEMQREWKSRDNVYVEGVKIRTQTDEPEAPNEEEIAKFVEKQQAKRTEARAAAYAASDDDEEDASLDLKTKQELPKKSDSDVTNRISLPSTQPQFETREGQEGWQTLPREKDAPQ